MVRNATKKPKATGDKTAPQKTTSGSMSFELLREVRLTAALIGIGNAEVLDRLALPVIRQYRRGLK
jgi:hypothetical protein